MAALQYFIQVEDDFSCPYGADHCGCVLACESVSEKHERSTVGSGLFDHGVVELPTQHERLLEPPRQEIVEPPNLASGNGTPGREDLQMMEAVAGPVPDIRHQAGNDVNGTLEDFIDRHVGRDRR